MNARTLTLLSGAMLLLAAQFHLVASAQEAPPQSPPDARTQAQEREAVEPAVSNAELSEDPAAPEATTPAAAPAAEAPAAATPSTRFRTVDRLELESTAITGNRELPKVLYIVPWKKADLGDLVGRPANSLLDEVLTPVDRDVFRRQTDYFSKLQTPAAQSQGSTQAPAQPAPQSEQKSQPTPAPR